MRDAFVCQEKHCFKCGKAVIVRDDWVLKRGSKESTKYFCSWKCLRSFEQKKASNAETRTKIKQAIREGLSTIDIVKLLEVDRQRVVYWQRKLEAENESHKSRDKGL